MRKLLTVVGLPVVLGACGQDGGTALNVTTSVFETPAGEGSGEPFLSSHGDVVYMSWLESAPGGGHDLRFAATDGGGWTEPRTIAHSDRFFVNWADFPSVTAAADGTLWAHWLQRGPAGGYDYGVRVAHSADGGATWSEPWTPHDDASPTEHGFVSMVPTEDGMSFVWLDGRNFAEQTDGSEPSREMTLRYRTATASGEPGPEVLLDGRVCDCCQTDAVLASTGPVVVYRDRTTDEYRDIFVTRLVDGAWTEGTAVHRDGWKTYACPVNGPAVGAQDDDVAVAWFAAPGDEPSVKVAFSADAGASFGAPIEIDAGQPAGRVDLLMREDGSALVSWLERTGGENAEVRLRRVAPDGTMSDMWTLTGTSEARASGFPRMIVEPGGDLLLAWTDAKGERPQVRVTRIEMEGS